MEVGVPSMVLNKYLASLFEYVMDRQVLLSAVTSLSESRRSNMTHIGRLWRLNKALLYK